MSEKVRSILLVTVGYTIGGTERMIEMLAPEFKKRGYSVSILSFKGWGVISERLKGKGIDCYSLSGKGRFDFRVLWRYFLFLKRKRPDIVIAFLYRAYIPTRILGFMLSIRNISSVEEIMKWMNPIQRFIERITARISLAIRACSDEVREFMTKSVGLPNERVMTVHNGIEAGKYSKEVIDSQPLNSTFGSSKITVGTVSRLIEPLKGIKYLLKVAENLKDRGDCQFLIVGGGRDEKELIKFAEERNLNVKFTGEREDIPSILQVMDIFVIPSLREGLPVALLEAMAAGLPVVASDVGGIPEVIVDGFTGFLVKPGSAEELTSKIQILLNNTELRNRFGERAKERVKKEFSIEKVADGLESLWKRFK